MHWLYKLVVLAAGDSCYDNNWIITGPLRSSATKVSLRSLSAAAIQRCGSYKLCRARVLLLATTRRQGLLVARLLVLLSLLRRRREVGSHVTATALPLNWGSLLRRVQMRGS